jgi:hypothetical protein
VISVLMLVGDAVQGGIPLLEGCILLDRKAGHLHGRPVDYLIRAANLRSGARNNGSAGPHSEGP